jgi:hypothetical protein
MGECKELVPGIGLVLLGAFLLWGVARERGKARLSAKLPVCPCGSPQEGMIQLAGTAVGAATVTSPLLGLPCLASVTKVEVYYKHAKKRKWRAICDEKKSVPFNVEDSSGSLWVDVTDADFYFSHDAQYDTSKWFWKPQAGHVQQIGDTPVTAEWMEQRVRAMYESNARQYYNFGDGNAQLTEAEREKLRQKAQRELDKRVKKAKLRASEKVLLAGDPVSVVGPAYQDPSSGAIRVHRVHPSDRFFLGDGAPEDLRARIHKEARWWNIGGIVMVVGGAALAISCFL